ncbi:site-specific integrase [Spirosoma sordidisoli]|uniref:Site-specific integrase n=1 Tax=Spirosoma sordidisoli TaxID=2502893 RepID=A0A4Q2UQD2_9BACT|nr:site-specific integrase [Spirosoma sordidisoli]RYC70011.1 site-specific integrase [Spirosoma sordidisoli]
MNEIYFKQKISKQDRSGFAPIFLEFNHNGGTLVLSTGEKCKPSDWNQETQKFRRSMPGYQQANESLERLRDKLRTAYRDARNADVAITNDFLRTAVSGRAVRRVADLPTLYDEYVESRRSEFKPATLKSMRNTGSRLRRLSDRLGTLRAEHYTTEVHQSVVGSMLDDGLEPSSVGQVCKHLITFFRYCRDTLEITLHPRHATIKKESAPSDRIYLTEADLQKLHAAAMPPNLIRVRDAFLFQCYTSLRYADLWRLQHRHIENRGPYSVIVLIPEKSVSRRATKIKRIEIPILPDAQTILDRYAGDYRLLPVLSNQKYNDYIKDVCELAGLTELVEQIEYRRGVPYITQVPKWSRVSSHVARHTWATLSLMKGVPLEVVSKTLGHSNLHTTMIYAKVVDDWKNQQILSAWATQ